jgi:putative selenate reductase
MLPVDQRGGFDLVEGTLTGTAARDEAARCLQCAAICDKCIEVCPNRANYAYSISPVNVVLPQLSCRQGKLEIAGREAFQIEQTRQIIHVDDFCNECGNCATFCVHPGKPYVQKPRLYLKRGDFELEENNAFYIEGGTIWRREKGRESQVSSDGGILVFENAAVRIGLSPDLRVEEMTLKEPFEGTFSLREAIEMVLILRGVTTSLPFLARTRPQP